MLVSAGSRVRVEAGTRSGLADVAAAAGVTALAPAAPGTAYDVRLVLEHVREPFEPGARVVTRGVSVAADGTTTIDDVGGSGYAQQWSCTGDELVVRTRWCPAPRALAARHALRTRFRALRGQVLLHHPVLWWAAVRGLAPLHVSVLEIDGTAVLLAGPGGVGKSSLVARELAAGGRAVCDNLAVSDGTTVLGVAEPLKVPPETGSGDGPVALHGRREVPWPERLPALRPQVVVVLRRGDAAFATVRPTTPAAACRELVAGTFTAGELRRFWPLAASLALATDRGPAVPPVEAVAARLVQDLPCVEVRLGRVPGDPLRALLHDHLGEIPVARSGS
jgi:hypothetical protein